MAESREYEVEVRTAPDQAWRALTDPELTQQYFFGTRVESDFTPGSPIAYKNEQGGADVTGEVLEVEDERKLETTFQPAWAPSVEGRDPDRITWEIEPQGDYTRVKIVHHGFDPNSPGADQIDAGWKDTLERLKSTLEG